MLDELQRGRKTGHWIWFIFPQVAGLGRSETSRYYAIESLDEARAYLEHPCSDPGSANAPTSLLAVNGRSAEEILGPLDAIKVRSSVSLFHRASPDDPRASARSSTATSTECRDATDAAQAG